MANEETLSTRRDTLLAALSEVRGVWQRAAREAGEWQAVLDESLALMERLEFALDALSAPVRAERLEVRGEDTPDTPQAFLADLSVFAARQRDTRIYVTHKPMPY